MRMSGINWTKPFNNDRWCKIVTMSPERFLELALPLSGYDRGSIAYLEQTDKWEMPFLRVNVDTGEVLDHEGRHRCYILAQRGVKKIPVALCFEKLEDTPSDMWGTVIRRVRPIDAIGYPISKCDIKVSQLKPQRARGWIQ